MDGEYLNGTVKRPRLINETGPAFYAHHGYLIIGVEHRPLPTAGLPQA